MNFLSKIFSKITHQINLSIATGYFAKCTGLPKEDRLVIDRLFNPRLSNMRKSFFLSNLESRNPFDVIKEDRAIFHRHIQSWEHSSPLILSEKINMPSLPGKYNYPNQESRVNFYRSYEDVVWAYAAERYQRRGIAPKTWDTIIKDELKTADKKLMALSQTLIEDNEVFNVLKMPVIDRAMTDNEVNDAKYFHIEFIVGTIYCFPPQDIISFCLRDKSTHRLGCDRRRALNERLSDFLGEDTCLGWITYKNSMDRILKHLDNMSLDIKNKNTLNL